MPTSNTPGAPLEEVAGNGLLHRRAFLTHGMVMIGAAGLIARSPGSAAAADPPDVPPWMQSPGAGMSGYGVPAKYEGKVMRTGIDSKPGTTGSGASRTPLERLNGTITPSGLHFERHHSGVPDIDPDAHRLLIHGLVKRPLMFTVEALLRYPMVLAHPLPRMLRATAAEPEPRRRAAGVVRQDPRPRVVQRVDRRAAVDRCWRRRASTRGAHGCSPKAPTPPR